MPRKARLTLLYPDAENAYGRAPYPGNTRSPSGSAQDKKKKPVFFLRARVYLFLSSVLYHVKRVPNLATKEVERGRDIVGGRGFAS